jgi:hypothetical protein
LIAQQWYSHTELYFLVVCFKINHLQSRGHMLALVATWHTYCLKQEFANSEALNCTWVILAQLHLYLSMFPTVHVESSYKKHFLLQKLYSLYLFSTFPLYKSSFHILSDVNSQKTSPFQIKIQKLWVEATGKAGCVS